MILSYLTEEPQSPGGFGFGAELFSGNDIENREQRRQSEKQPSDSDSDDASSEEETDAQHERRQQQHRRNSTEHRKPHKSRPSARLSAPPCLNLTNKKSQRNYSEDNMSPTTRRESSLQKELPTEIEGSTEDIMEQLKA